MDLCLGCCHGSEQAKESPPVAFAQQKGIKRFDTGCGSRVLLGLELMREPHVAVVVEVSGKFGKPEGLGDDQAVQPVKKVIR